MYVVVCGGFSNAASRGRSSSAHGTVLAITSHAIQGSVRAVNDRGDPEWIRAKSGFDQTMESIYWRRPGLVERLLPLPPRALAPELLRWEISGSGWWLEGGGGMDSTS